MTLTDIAAQNLRRRKGKTMFLLFTFLLVVGTLVALNTLAAQMQEDLQNTLSQYGANIVITPKSERFALSYGGLSIPGVNFEIKKLNYKVLDQIKTNGVGINGIAPKIIGAVQGVNSRYLLVGVDFPSELKMKPWWKVQGSTPQNGEIVVGSTLAAKLQITVGSSLELNRSRYPVVGIMQETGGSEDNALFTTLTTAEEFTGIDNQLSIVELNALQPDKTAEQLRAELPQAKVEEVSQLVQGAKESVERFSGYASSASVLLGVIGMMILLITMAGNINERISELGILRAIGFRRKHIVSIIVREIAILSVTGGVLGYGIGMISSTLLAPLLIQKQVVFQFQPLTALVVLGGTVLGGLISIAYPAWRAVSLEPLEALRFI